LSSTCAEGTETLVDRVLVLSNEDDCSLKMLSNLNSLRFVLVTQDGHIAREWKLSLFHCLQWFYASSHDGTISSNYVSIL